MKKVLNQSPRDCIPALRQSPDDSYPSLFSDEDKTNALNNFFASVSTVEDSDSYPSLFSDEDKANALNIFFASVSTVEDSGKPVPNLDVNCHSELDNVIISVEDVYGIIKSLQLNKAAGPDRINHRLLAGIAQSVKHPLTILFNLSLKLSSFPRQWKHAHVMPLFKKGDRSLCSNYRPISLLSCLGKLFERCVFKHVYNYFHSNALLYKFQSGFIPCHSTVHQLIEINDNVCKSLDRKEYFCMFFCDISKAFDRVWHKGLVYKLSRYVFVEIFYFDFKIIYRADHNKFFLVALSLINCKPQLVCLKAPF